MTERFLLKHARHQRRSALAVLWFVVALALVGGVLGLPVPAVAQSAGEDPNLLRNFTSDVPFLVGGWGGIRRALLNVWGVVSDPQRQLDQNFADSALVKQYYQGNPQDQQDIAFLQRIAPARAYLPGRLGSQGGTVAGASAGQVLQSSTAGTPGANPCEQITNLDDFVAQCAAFTKQRGIGRVSLLMDAFDAMAGQVTASTTASLIAYQGAQPEYVYERQLAQGSSAGSTAGAATGQQQVVTGAVEKDATETLIQARSIQGDAPREKFTLGTPLHIGEGAEGVAANKPLPSQDEHQQDDKVCVKNADGRKTCSSGIVQSGAGYRTRGQGGGCSVCNASGGVSPFGTGSILQNLGGFFGGNIPGLSSQLFGSNLGIFQNMFGENRFWDLAQSLFGGANAGAGGTPPSPTVNPGQQTGACIIGNAALSSAQAVQAAQLLGVQPGTQAWTPIYRPASSLVGLNGYNPETQEFITIAAETFSPAGVACVWQVTGSTVNGVTDVAILSDSTAPGATGIHLLVTQ